MTLMLLPFITVANMKLSVILISLVIIYSSCLRFGEIYSPNLYITAGILKVEKSVEQWGQTPIPIMELVQIVIQDLITIFYTQ